MEEMTRKQAYAIVIADVQFWANYCYKRAQESDKRELPYCSQIERKWKSEATRTVRYLKHRIKILNQI